MKPITIVCMQHSSLNCTIYIAYQSHDVLHGLFFSDLEVRFFTTREEIFFKRITSTTTTIKLIKEKQTHY